METQLYKLPKDLLIQIITNMKEENKKEIKEELKKCNEGWIKENKALEKRYKAVREISNVRIKSCSNKDCDAFEVYDTHDFQIQQKLPVNCKCVVFCNHCERYYCDYHRSHPHV